MYHAQISIKDNNKTDPQKFYGVFILKKALNDSPPQIFRLSYGPTGARHMIITIKNGAAT